MNNMKTLLAFALGAAVGSVVTWKIVKTKYEQIAQEEIDSVKEVFKKRLDEFNDETDNCESDEEVIEDDFSEYVEKANKYHTESNEKIEKEEKGGSESMENIEPVVISPDEFGENEDYETITLYYFNDGVLADELDKVVDDIEGTVGLEALNSYGQYEDDSVFVRNDRLKCYYEILKDCDNYADLNLTVKE